jgi:hypothetical protein
MIMISVSLFFPVCSSIGAVKALNPTQGDRVYKEFVKICCN